MIMIIIIMIIISIMIRINNVTTNNSNSNSNSNSNAPEGMCRRQCALFPNVCALHRGGLDGGWGIGDRDSHYLSDAYLSTD